MLISDNPVDLGVDLGGDRAAAPKPAPLPAKHPKFTPILSNQALSELNAKSDLKGFRQLAGHLAVMVISGGIWAIALPTLGAHWFVALPAVVIYGFSLAAMFAPLHECAHRTAFANNQINDAVAWCAGLLAFYNSTFYRLYHKWHHRYTQIPGKDPELSDPKPTNRWAYCVEISGWNWWIGKFRGHFRTAIGQLADCPFIPETSRATVVRSLRLQLLVYATVIGLSTACGQPGVIVWYWLLPLAIGQPILRFILLAEHTDRPTNDNLLTNTRTTLTLWPLRFLVWNIPFHAEHHLYASLPFHALPAAHEQLKPHFDCVESGYVKVHRQIIAHLGKAAA
jgi:fatty acid desaturase